MGTSQSCGCATLEALAQRNEHDLTGKRFDRLTVVECLGSNKHQKREYRCLCDCGNHTIVVGSDLINGHTKSCGCIHYERFIEHMANKKNTRIIKGAKISKEYRKEINKFLVNEKDKFPKTCAICNSKQRIHLHHLWSVNNKPELAIEHDNLIQLCSKCHKAFHEAFYNGMNTPIQFIEFCESYT